MNTAIRLVTDIEDKQANTDCNASGGETRSCGRQDEARWTTKQVIGACLWSTLFGLGCGYVWLFLHIVTGACP